LRNGATLANVRGPNTCQLHMPVTLLGCQNLPHHQNVEVACQRPQPLHTRRQGRRQRLATRRSTLDTDMRCALLGLADRLSVLRGAHMCWQLTRPGCLRRGSRLVRRAATSQARPDADACVYALFLTVQACWHVHCIRLVHTEHPVSTLSNIWWQALQLALQTACCTAWQSRCFS